MARGVRTIRVRFDGDVKGLAAAAARGERIVADFGDKAGRKFTLGVDKGINRSLTATIARAAGRAVTGFGIALQGGALRDPRIAGALGAAVLAGVVVAMPVIGSLAAGLLVGAFGAGLAGLGIAFAAKSKQLKATAKAVFGETAKTMRQISKPFELALLSSLGHFQAFFASIAADLRDAFARMAPAIDEFVGHLADALGPKGLGKIIGPVTDAFVRMLDALGPELPRIMRSLADGIIAVANSISENPQTFVSLIAWLARLVSGALKFVAALSRVANWFQEHPTVTKTLIIALKNLLIPFYSVYAAAKVMLDGIQRAMGGSQRVTRTASTAIRVALNALRELPGRVAGWFRSIYNAIRERLSSAVAVVRSIPGKIRAAFGNPGAMLRGIGSAIINGLAAGIRAAAGSAVRAAVGVVSSAIAAAKRHLHIGSPSKLAAREVGLPIGQGIAVGMKRTHRLVSRAGTRLAGAALPAPGRVVGGPASTAGGIHIDRLEVKAFQDRFSLRQVQDELALHGVA